MNLLVYLLKVVVVSAIFLGYYRFFLRNKRFHHYNRFFLLSALLLSVVLPLIRIPLLHQPENPVNEAIYRTVAVINSDYGENDPGMTGTVAVNVPVFTLVNSIYLVYGIGALFLLTLVIKSLLYINGLRKSYPAEQITNLRFYNTHEPGTPFSFFRSVFWNDQLPFNSHEGQQIFRHELFHVQHRHSADRLLSELLTAVFWFNPFFHFIKKELKAIHEFLADQFAVSGSDRYAYATLLVQQALDPGRHAVTNHFFQNHIKRRIAMITQFQKSNYGYWSRVMILPVLLLLFCAITLYAKKTSNGTVAKMQTAQWEPPLTVLVDAGHGGSDNGAPSQDGSIREKDLAFISDEANQEKIAGAILQGIMEYKKTAPAAGPVDTLPVKEAKEKELLKVRQAQLEAIRQKMKEQETVIKKTRLLELEQIKKQMREQELLSREQELLSREQELLSREQEVIKQRQVRELIALKKDLMNQQMEVEKQKIKQLMDQESERKQMAEIESKSHQQVLIQKARQAELEILKSKLKEREKELRKEQEEIERKIREKKKGDEQSALKPKTAHWALMQEDSLLKNVIRHYLRTLSYPGTAMKHKAQGQIYFSVVVDRNGHFKDFIAYTDKPRAGNIKDLVVVGYTPVAAVEEKLSIAQEEKIFAEEVRLATARANNKPVAHPDERTYYFRAVFKLEDLNGNTKLFPKKPSAPMPALFSKKEPRQLVFAKKNSSILFGPKKNPVFKTGSKIFIKPRSPINAKPAAGPGHTTEGQEEHEASYSKQP